MLHENPDKPLNQLLKHMFHGTRATDPSMVYSSKDGMDIRFANAGGAYGAGNYFANNSAYSLNY